MTWEVKSLDELIDDGVIELGRGKVISKIDLEATPGPYPVYSSAKENDGMFGSYGHYMFDEELITWSVDGGGNLFHRPKHKFSVTNVGGTLRILDRSKFHYQYLFYVLTYLHSSIPFDWVLKAHPSVIRRLYQEIPLAPLPEQQRIVGKLDAAFAALGEAQALVERNRANARELFESYLNGVHTGHEKDWSETTLGNEVEIVTGFPFSSQRYTDNDSDTKLLRGDNIVPGALRWDGVKRWPANEVEEYERYQLDTGDVVIAMDRTWIKGGLKYAVLAKEDLPCILVQRTARLRCGPRIDKRYLGYLIGSRDFTSYVLSVQTGIGVPHISGGQIADFGFMMPPLSVQVELGRTLETLEEQTKQLEATYQQKLSELAVLKKGLLSAAFRGEL